MGQSEFVELGECVVINHDLLPALLIDDIEEILDI
jgi:hypothetical protein